MPRITISDLHHKKLLDELTPWEMKSVVGGTTVTYQLNISPQEMQWLKLWEAISNPNRTPITITFHSR